MACGIALSENAPHMAIPRMARIVVKDLGVQSASVITNKDAAIAAGNTRVFVNARSKLIWCLTLELSRAAKRRRLE